MMTIGKTAIALGIAGAASTAAPSFAGPLPSSTAALKQAGVTASASNVEQVQWRGRGWHGNRGWGAPLAGAGVGFAAGALVGSAIASSNYYGGYGGYYGGGPYAYYDEPVYAAPAPVYRQVVPGGRCWITTGGNGQYGYWARC